MGSMFYPCLRSSRTRSLRFLSVLLVWLVGISIPIWADTVVKLGEIKQIQGPQDLDLDGEFAYAINFSADDPPRTVHGVTFLPDNKKITGATLIGPQNVTPWMSKPEFGDTPDDNSFEEILADIRWADSGSGQRLRATLVITNGFQYQLQVLISANNPENRRWDIRIDGKDAVDEITSLGASPGQSYSVDRATLYTYTFLATTNKLVVEMGDLFGLNDGGDRNPIWQALTLKHAFTPPTPDDITLNPSQFFPNQTLPIGQFRSVDRKIQPKPSFALVPGDGDKDNAKFSINGPLLLAKPFDFSSQPPGSSYSIRVRTTDLSDTNRWLEKTFSVVLAVPHAPTGLKLDAEGISTSVSAGSTVGLIQVSDVDPFDTHAIALVAGAGDTDNELFVVVGNQLRAQSQLPTDRNAYSIRLQATDLAGLSIAVSIVLPVAAPNVRINELLASSQGGAPDESGASSEYVELFNDSSQWVDLSGYYLTDQPSDRTRWKFPSGSLPPYGFLVVLADGRGVAPTGSKMLHASFSLDATGSKVALVDRDGSSILSRMDAPVFYPGVSYGVTEGGTNGYFKDPTPGSTNGVATLFGANSVLFSQAHGFFAKTFDLQLTSSIPGSVIRYTTDGTIPTTNKGTIYTKPIAIHPATNGPTRGSRIIRAIAIHPDAAYTPIVTQTYLFVRGEGTATTDAVVGQSGLLTSITKSPLYSPWIDDALLALPAVSLVMSPNPDPTERSASLELLDPDGNEEGFQIDCGIKATGTTSLSSPKLSLAAKFRSDYGLSKLKYPLFARGSMFPQGAATEFKEIRIRSHSHDTFYWLATSENPPVPYGDPPVNRSGDAQYARNPWIDEMQMMMGQPGKHGRQVHLFLNGEYHGLYYIHEHADEHYMASYYSGGPSDYHFSAAALSGSEHAPGDTWRQPWNSMKASLKTYTEAQRWVDMTNLCDYMVLSFYAGNDWDWSAQHNWSAAGPRFADRGGWKFFEQDSDIALQDIVADCTDQDVPDGIFTALMAQTDFRSLFRDRVYKHCFNGGALTPQRAGAFYDAKMNEIVMAIVAETARWQPSSSVSPLPWDRNQEWTNEWRYLRETYFPQRSTKLVTQLRKHANWWPIDPPNFAQVSGTVPVGYPLQVSTFSGTLYYTTDGSDPRLPGGKINPNAVRMNVALTTNRWVASGAVWKFLDTGVTPTADWKGANFDDSAWRSGPTEIGYGDGGEATVAGFVDTDPVATGIQRNITTWFRKTFDAPALSNVQSLKLRVVRDDGVVVYLNGVEIFRNNMPAGPIEATNRALVEVIGADESTFQEANYTVQALDLRPTGNVFAVEVHQRTPASTDMSFNLEMLAYSWAPNSSIPIQGPTLLHARAYTGTDWSAMVEVSLGTDSVPSASAQQLILSEIHFNPLDQAGNEFLEFWNTSASAVDLSELVLTQAVSFRFPRPTVLGANERIVVAKDLALFGARYQTNTSPYYHAGIRVLGPWTGSLANEGEEIVLLSPEGNPIFSCSYATGGLWPALANGAGSSLEVVHGETAPGDGPAKSAWLSDPTHWQASVEFHGTPGWAGEAWNQSVVFNELLVASSPPATDAVEIKNVSAQSVDLSGVWMSDSSANYKKYQFPAGTTLDAGQFRVLRESDFNHPGSPSNPVPFAFSSSGESAYLVQADANGALLRFLDTVTYGSVDRDVPLGRWPDGVGAFAWLRSATLGASNALPVTGYAAWAAVAFPPGTSADLTSRDADPDGDGLSNAAEYAFALNPLSRDSTRMVISKGPTPNVLTLQYRKRAAAPDIEYRIESSKDLQTWSTLSNQLTTVSEDLQVDGSSWVTLRWTLPVSVGGAPTVPAFVRLVAVP